MKITGVEASYTGQGTLKYNTNVVKSVITAADKTEQNVLTVVVNIMLEDIPLGTPVNYSAADKIATNHSGWWVGLGLGYTGMPADKKYIACHILNAASDTATATNNKCWWSMFDAN
jgi:hypothetical protein